MQWWRYPKVLFFLILFFEFIFQNNSIFCFYLFCMLYTDMSDSSQVNNHLFCFICFISFFFFVQQQSQSPCNMDSKSIFICLTLTIVTKIRSICVLVLYVQYQFSSYSKTTCTHLCTHTYHVIHMTPIFLFFIFHGRCIVHLCSSLQIIRCTTYFSWIKQSPL